MRWMKWTGWVVLALVVGFTSGCESGGDSTPDTGGGSYTGNWLGTACNGTRGFGMVLVQSGTNLTGTFTFTNPDASGPLDGSVTVQTPPAPAFLTSTLGRTFEITFGSYANMNGVYYKDGVLTCNIKAAK